MEESKAYTDNITGKRGLLGANTLESSTAPYLKELDELQKTLNLLGDLQDRMHHKLKVVRSKRLSKAEPLAEPTSPTGESPLVTSLKSLNYQSTRILQNFSNTYDEIDL